MLEGLSRNVKLITFDWALTSMAFAWYLIVATALSGVVLFVLHRRVFGDLPARGAIP
jgi:hypothetical protein